MESPYSCYARGIFSKYCRSETMAPKMRVEETLEKKTARPLCEIRPFMLGKIAIYMIKVL